MKEKVMIKVNQIVPVEDYNPNGIDQMYVAMVDDLCIFRGMNPKKNNGVSCLICTATLPEISEIATKYGRKIILVDKKFARLSKKQRRILIEIENQKLLGIDPRLIPNYEDSEILGSNIGRQISAELCAMEKYGVRPVRKALKKSAKRIARTEKSVGRYMFKENKKLLKKMSKSTTIQEELEPPVTLQNTTTPVCEQ